MQVKKLAKITSFVFHPFIFFLLMPYIVIYRQFSSSAYALKWTIFSSIFIFFIAFIFFLGRWKGLFSDDDITQREERYRFYVLAYVSTFLYFVASLFIKGIFFPLSIIAFGIIIGIVLFNIINYYTKASIHTGVACAYVVTIGILFGLTPFLLSVWIVPVVSASRVLLKKHTIGETIIGGFVGVLITLFTFLAEKYIV